MTQSLHDLETRLPWIPWREPIQVALIGSPEDKRYACRICIANQPLIGEMIPTLPSEPRRDPPAHRPASLVSPANS